MDMENSVNLREKKHWQLVINSLNCQCSLLYGAKANSLLCFWCVPSSAAYNLIVRTMTGRGRAFLKYSLMQKRMGEYFKLMVENQTGIR